MQERNFKTLPKWCLLWVLTISTNCNKKLQKFSFQLFLLCVLNLWQQKRNTKWSTNCSTNVYLSSTIRSAIILGYIGSPHFVSFRTYLLSVPADKQVEHTQKYTFNLEAWIMNWKINFASSIKKLASFLKFTNSENATYKILWNLHQLFDWQ